MKKKIYIITIILILIFFILFFYKSDNNIFDDITIFSLWENMKKENEYVINPEKEENISIDVYKSIQNGTKLYKKIAPGSYGQFVIKLTRPKDTKCKIILKDITYKPQNLEFILKNKRYNKLEQMENILNDIFNTEDEVTISWNWKYQNTDENNIKDTKDGKIATKYIFEVKAIIEK